jgi:hypothetical protein
MVMFSGYYDGYVGYADAHLDPFIGAAGSC